MNDPKEIRKLIYSLKMIGDFSEKVDSVNSREEFLTIHNRNIASLNQLSKFRETNYFTEKVKEYPVVTDAELDEYIKKQRNERSLPSVILAGVLYSVVELIYKAARTKGNSLGGTKNKLKLIKSINDNLIYVVENPGFEELITKQSMQNNAS